MNPTPQKKSSGRSCLVYGCLSLIVVFVVALLVVFFGIRHYVNSMVQNFTEAAPRHFEAATLPEAESQALEERLQEFDRELQGTNQAAQIALDSRELNALIVTNPKLAALKDRVRVQLEGDHVQCLISVPLDSLSHTLFLGGLKGRYLNATARVGATVDKGRLDLKLVGATVKSVELPSEMLAELEKKLPWEEIQNSPEVKKLIDQIDWLKVAEGKVQLGKGEPKP
jgi:hypothetical protein